MTKVISKADAEAKLKKARRLRTECNMPWPQVAKECGVSRDWLQRRLDPKFALRVRMYERDRQSLRSTQSGRPGRPYPNMKEDAAARLAEIPPDTRDNTGRFCGDPLPG